MKKFLLAFLAALSSICLCAQTYHKDYKDGQLYLRVEIGALKPVMSQNPRKIDIATLDFLSALKEKYGIDEVMRPFAQADDDALLPYILRVQFSNVSKTADFMRDLEALPQIKYCEKVPLMKTDLTPNEGIPTHLAQINAANAWNLYSGFSNVRVAIVDNAVMWNHVDLVQNTFTNTAEIAGNGIDDDNNGYIDDRNGWDCSNWDNNSIPTNNNMSHGTHCAGIAAATTSNGIGVASIGWGIRMIPVKTEFDNGSTTSISNGYDGIIYAAKINARIISCSWGGAGFATTEQAIVNYAWNRGCIVIASAGNANSTTQNYPGAYANVYCVAACDPSDVKSTFSNYGTWVDITAPGNAINSTVPYTGTLAAYQPLSGTSMATPMVAGLAGLMLSLSPNMTRTNVLNCISSTAVNIYTLTGNATFSATAQLGAGRIEAFLAMQCASTFSAMPPVANFFATPKITCPNTPVQFSDSSLYQPTSWSWVFQGGTPATSTSSAPVVSYTAAGTYSVAMTCSNVNGSSNITKLSYITVAAPINLPFFEGFQNTTFLPLNWTDKNIDNDVIFWQRRTNLGGFGTSTACSMFDNYTYNAAGERDEMRSPKFDFSTVTAARLRFDVAYARYDAVYSDSLEVRLSTNCGQTWTSIYLRGGSQFTTAANTTAQFVPTAAQWRRDSIDISALTAGQGNVMFAFINRGHYGQAIYLDNINLAFPTPTLNVAYNSTICTNATVNFSNTSVGASSYTWNSPGAIPATSNGTAATLSYSTAGVYNVTLTAQNGTTFTNTVRSVTVFAFPTTAAANASICAGQTASLSGSGASAYVWTAAGGTISTFVSALVSPTADATYTLTGFNSTCSSSVAVNVSVVPLPVLVANSVTVCPGGIATISVSGASTYTWNTGSNASSFTVSPTFSFVLLVNGTSNTCVSSKTLAVVVNSNVIVAANATPSLVCTGAVANFTAGGALTYTWNGTTIGNTYSMIATTNTVITVLGNDGNCTGSKQVTLNVVAPPSLSITPLPSGTLCAGTTVTLIAGGASNYTWTSTGASGFIFSQSVNNSTNFALLGSNGACTTSTSINIPVQALPQISVSANSSSICPGSSAALIANGASSYNWSTGSFNQSITVTPSVSSVYTVTGVFNTCSNTSTIAVTVFSNVIISANVSPTIICTGAVANYSAGGALTYTWNGSSTGSTYSLTASTSTLITVSGNDGNCVGSTQVSLTVVAPPSISIAATPTGTVCAGVPVVLQASGASTYTWANNTTATNSIGFTASTNTVIAVTGSNAACSSTAAISITVQAIPQLNISISTNSLCAGQTATANATGASTYSWSNGITTSTAIIAASTSTVISVVGTSNNCSSSASFSIQVYALPQSNVVTGNASCNGKCDGSINISTIGNAPFTYSVGSICNAATCNSLCAGSYTALIGDNNGCIEIRTFTVTQPSAINASITAVNPTCGACNNGSMTSITSGGTPGYSYTWSPNAGNGPEASFLTNGCYTLTVVDSRNCSFQTSKCIENTVGFEEHSAIGLKLYPNPNQGVFTVEIGITADVKIYSALGQLVLDHKLIAGSNTIELYTYAKGIYLLSVSKGNVTEYHKLIIE